MNKEPQYSVMGQKDEPRFNFRLWDKKTKQYVATDRCDRLVFGGSSYWCEGDSVSCGYRHTHTIPGSDIIIEQCTGLKDMNGTYIYEGDLLGLSKDGDEYTVVQWCSERACFMCFDDPITEDIACKLIIKGKIHDLYNE